MNITEGRRQLAGRKKRRRRSEEESCRRQELAFAADRDLTVLRGLVNVVPLMLSGKKLLEITTTS
jgi:sulfur transfer protein SufE